MTTIYFVRHASSPYVHGKEKERGLSYEGQLKALDVAETLKSIDIACVVSSSYQRAIDTVLPLAKEKQMKVITFDSLRERSISSLDVDLPWETVKQGIKLSFDDKDFALEDGESTRAAQNRSIPIFESLLDQYNGESIVIGTHGNIMTVILNYYDDCYGYDFWKGLYMPDILKVSFEGKELRFLERIEIKKG